MTSDLRARVEALLAEHVHPGEVLSGLGDAWMICGCGERFDLEVVDQHIADVNGPWFAHTSAAIVALLADTPSDPAPAADGGEVAQMAEVIACAEWEFQGVHGTFRIEPSDRCHAIAYALLASGWLADLRRTERAEGAYHAMWSYFLSLPHSPFSDMVQREAMRLKDIARAASGAGQ